jgi:SAM-dependent methyltransferase
MSKVRSAARIFADHGLPGLARRVVQKLRGARPAPAPVPRGVRAEPASVDLAGENATPAVPDPASAPAPRLPDSISIPVVSEPAPCPPESVAVAAEPPVAEPSPTAPLTVTPEEIARGQREFEERYAAFRTRCAELGHTGVEHYYWYHTVDLGDGLVTPGSYDYRPQLANFGFPEDMTGMRVLDVGSATGYFAFEFERRGAEVVSVELPSLGDWDIISSEREYIVRQLMTALHADSPEQAHDRCLPGPFRFCQAVLGSKVRRCYSTVYDLTEAKTGGKFDLVYAGDIVMHLFSPFEAFDVLSNLTRGALMTTIEAPFPVEADEPLLAFRGYLYGKEEGRTWWLYNRAAVRHMLLRLGFSAVEVVGQYSGLSCDRWFPYRREVIRATR